MNAKALGRAVARLIHLVYRLDLRVDPLASSPVTMKETESVWLSRFVTFLGFNAGPTPSLLIDQFIGASNMIAAIDLEFR
jgi:hypothetical protein